MNIGTYPKKIFTMGDMHNCILTNAEENISFMKSRIDRLISAHNDRTALNSEMESIFTEFIDVYEFDKKKRCSTKPHRIF